MTDETEQDTQDTTAPEPEETLSQALEREWAAAEEVDSPPVDEPTDEKVDTKAADTDSEDKADDEAEFSPPEHWSAEDKEAFEKLPGEAQQFYKKVVGAQKEDPEIAGLRSAFDPIKDFLEANGVPLSQAATTLVNTYRMLQQQPVEFIKQIAQAKQVEDQLKELYGNSKEVEDAVDTYVDPDIKALRQEIRELKRATATPASQDIGPDQTVIAEIQRFREDKDDSGKLKHPYFDKVYDTMSAMIWKGAAGTLDDAYSKAVWAVPEFKDQHIKAEIEARQKTLETEAKAKADKARKAATTVNGKGSTTPEPPGPRSLGQDLLENWNKAERGEL